METQERQYDLTKFPGKISIAAYYDSKRITRMPDTAPLCVIPARGISTGLPKKNFKRIDGKPLVAYIIESALDADEIDHVIVTTESEKLAKIAREFGADVPFLRPAELSEPDVLMNDVIEHAITNVQSSNSYEVTSESPIVVLQPNVPFTRPEDIDRALRKYRQGGQNAIISVVEEYDFFWWGTNNHLEPLHQNRVLRSDLDPLFRETGAIYITNESILTEGDRVGSEPSYIITDKLSAFEVDSLLDLWLAERIKEGPTILFRVDGGDEIGMGHIYRCLTLAQELEDVIDCDITFLSDRQRQAGIEKIKSHGFDVVPGNMSKSMDLIRNINPDIIFLDVLDTDNQYVQQLHELSAAIINLEDLGDGMEHADYVVNALYEDESHKENQFFGADYLVLEDRFIEQSVNVRREVQNILLTFGGSDPSNLSTRVAKELASNNLGYQFRLVLGPDFEFEEELQQLPEQTLSEIDIYRDVPAMADIMKWADIAICSGGRTVYELAALGVPAIVIAHNSREMKRMEELDSLGVVEFLGQSSTINFDLIRETVIDLDENYQKRQEMSRIGQQFVDDSGTERILDIIHDILVG